jgi:hypothetical protein
LLTIASMVIGDRRPVEPAARVAADVEVAEHADARGERTGQPSAADNEPDTAESSMRHGPTLSRGGSARRALRAAALC